MTTQTHKRDLLTAIGMVMLMLICAGARADCIGTCGTDTANGDVTLPPGFTSYQYVTTAGGPTGGGNLPAVFGAPGVTSTNGSTLSTAPFTAPAGEPIAFDFNYVTSDGSGFPDYAWAALMSANGGSNYLIFSAETQPSGNTVPGITMPLLAPGASLTPPASPILPGSGSQCGSGDCNTVAGGPVWAELGSSSGNCWALGCGLTGWIQSKFNGEAAGTYQLEFGVSNANDEIYDSGLALAGCQSVLNGAMAAPSGGGSTEITDTFTPNFGLTLSQAASDCGFKAFDWVQTITSLPDPSPFYEVNAADPAAPIHLTSASAPFNDPPPGGYTYCANTFCGSSYPYYYPASDAISNPNYCITYDGAGNCLTTLDSNSGKTLNFFDSPQDPCLFGGNSTGVQGCDGANAPPGSAIDFTTDLVGILPDNSVQSLGMGFTWTDNFNGGSGGVSTISNVPADPSTGTGGVTITSFSDVTQYGIGTPPSVPEPPSSFLLLTGALLLLCTRASYARRMRRH